MQCLKLCTVLIALTGSSLLYAADNTFTINITGPDDEVATEPVQIAPRATRPRQETTRTTVPRQNVQRPAVRAQRQTPARAQSTYTVQPQDTIWSIASSVIPVGSNVNEFQAIASIYRNNPNAFANGNINNLRRTTLNIPSIEEMALESSAEGNALLRNGTFHLSPLNRVAQNTDAQLAYNNSQINVRGNETNVPVSNEVLQAIRQNRDYFANATNIPAVTEVAGNREQNNNAVNNVRQNNNNTQNVQVNSSRVNNDPALTTKSTNFDIPQYVARETAQREALYNSLNNIQKSFYDDNDGSLRDKDGVTINEVNDPSKRNTAPYINARPLTEGELDLEAVRALVEKSQTNLNNRMQEMDKKIDQNILRAETVAKNSASVVAKEEVVKALAHYESVIADLQQSNAELRASISKFNKQIDQIRSVSIGNSDKLAELEARYYDASYEDDSPMPEGPMMWILLGVGLLCLVLALSYMVLKGKNKKHQEIMGDEDDIFDDVAEDVLLSSTVAHETLDETDVAEQKEDKKEDEKVEESKEEETEEEISAPEGASKKEVEDRIRKAIDEQDELVIPKEIELETADSDEQKAQKAWDEAASPDKKESGSDTDIMSAWSSAFEEQEKAGKKVDLDEEVPIHSEKTTQTTEDLENIEVDQGTHVASTSISDVEEAMAKAWLDDLKHQEDSESNDKLGEKQDTDSVESEEITESQVTAEGLSNAPAEVIEDTEQKVASASYNAIPKTDALDPKDLGSSSAQDNAKNDVTKDRDIDALLNEEKFVEEGTHQESLKAQAILDKMQNTADASDRNDETVLNTDAVAKDEVIASSVAIKDADKSAEQESFDLKDLQDKFAAMQATKQGAVKSSQDTIAVDTDNELNHASVRSDDLSRSKDNIVSEFVNMQKETAPVDDTFDENLKVLLGDGKTTSLQDDDRLNDIQKAVNSPSQLKTPNLDKPQGDVSLDTTKKADNEGLTDNKSLLASSNREHVVKATTSGIDDFIKSFMEKDNLQTSENFNNIFNINTDDVVKVNDLDVNKDETLGYSYADGQYKETEYKNIDDRLNKVNSSDVRDYTDESLEQYQKETLDSNQSNADIQVTDGSTQENFDNSTDIQDLKEAMKASGDDELFDNLEAKNIADAINNVKEKRHTIADDIDFDSVLNDKDKIKDTNTKLGSNLDISVDDDLDRESLLQDGSSKAQDAKTDTKSQSVADSPLNDNDVYEKSYQSRVTEEAESMRERHERDPDFDVFIDDDEYETEINDNLNDEIINKAREINLFGDDNKKSDNKTDNKVADTLADDTTAAVHSTDSSVATNSHVNDERHVINNQNIDDNAVDSLSEIDSENLESAGTILNTEHNLANNSLDDGVESLLDKDTELDTTASSVDKTVEDKGQELEQAQGKEQDKGSVKRGLDLILDNKDNDIADAKISWEVPDSDFDITQSLDVTRDSGTKALSDDEILGIAPDKATEEAFSTYTLADNNLESDFAKKDGSETVAEDLHVDESSAELTLGQDLQDKVDEVSQEIPLDKDSSEPYLEDNLGSYAKKEADDHLDINTEADTDFDLNAKTNADIDAKLGSEAVSGDADVEDLADNLKENFVANTDARGPAIKQSDPYMGSDSDMISAMLGSALDDDHTSLLDREQGHHLSDEELGAMLSHHDTSDVSDILERSGSQFNAVYNSDRKENADVSSFTEVSPDLVDSNSLVSSDNIATKDNLDDVDRELQTRDDDTIASNVETLLQDDSSADDLIYTDVDEKHQASGNKSDKSVLDDESNDLSTNEDLAPSFADIDSQDADYGKLEGGGKFDSDTNTHIATTSDVGTHSYASDDTVSEELLEDPLNNAIESALPFDDDSGKIENNSPNYDGSISEKLHQKLTDSLNLAQLFFETGDTEEALAIVKDIKKRGSPDLVAMVQDLENRYVNN